MRGPGGLVVVRHGRRFAVDASGAGDAEIGGVIALRGVMTRSPIRFRWLALAGGVAGCVLAGTSVAAAAEVRPGIAPPVPPDGDDAAMVVVLYDWFGVVGPQDADGYVALFDDNGDNAVGACMADAGFQFEQPPSGVESRFEAPEMAMDPYGYASQFGLGIAASSLGLFPVPDDLDAGGNPTQEYFDSLSQGQRDAYFEQLTACVDEADVDGGAERQMAMNIAAPAYRTVVYADERVVTALEEWQTCLADAGFEFIDPERMRLSFWEQVEPYAGPSPVDPGTPEYEELERIFATEREVALVNVRCEPAYEAAVRDVVADRLADFWELFDAALATQSADDESVAATTQA